MRRLISLSTACVLLSTSFTHTSAQTNTIHVEIGRPTGVIVRPLIGFNSGIAGADAPKDDFSPDTSSLIAALSPSFWKVTTPYHYRMAASYGARIQFETVDSYFGYNPKPFPWHDWQGYSQAIEDAVSTSLSRNAPVFLWDIWNEPQLRSYDDPALILVPQIAECERWVYVF